MIFLTPTWSPIVFSVYGNEFDGRRTAMGSRFSQSRISCASNLVKLGTKIELKVGNRTVIAVVNDRIHPRFSTKRIDCSAALWNKLTNGRKHGLAKGFWRKL